MQTIKPVKKLSNVHAINQKAIAASGRIYSVLQEESKVQERSRAAALDEFRNSIEFDHVTFAYNDNDEVLVDIDLCIDRGAVVALVGHSGAGKSTLVGLLARFYDPQRGTIRIDGRDIRDFKIKSLRDKIAIVAQDMVLFNTTVRDNIAYGKENATESEIIEAARKAHALEFVEEMPDGFATIIGDRGFRLSGGQKQRIAIARAILKDAPILILDEATSQLDTASEQLIQEALYNLMKGKTAFVIAHRLSTVQNADKIVTMDKGRIVEVGAHQDLLAKGSVYKRLYELQFNV